MKTLCIIFASALFFGCAPKKVEYQTFDFKEGYLTWEFHSVPSPFSVTSKYRGSELFTEVPDKYITNHVVFEEWILNAMADEGWHLVSRLPGKAIFERPKR